MRLGFNSAVTVSKKNYALKLVVNFVRRYVIHFIHKFFIE